MCEIYLNVSFSVMYYLPDHEAHEAEDPHRDMSGRPHEEVDDVGVK